MPSNQQQIIDQTKFTYSPLGKTFEKQIKTIEDHGEKQIKAIQDQGQVKIIKKYYDDEDTPFISKQKENCGWKAWKLVDERLEKINDFDERVNSDDLIYRYKGRTADAKFDEFDNALDTVNKIRDGKTDLADVKNNQQKFKSYLGKIKKGNKSKEQKNAFCNIEMLYKARNKAIKFYDDYSLMMSEAKTKATKGTGLKILTPKQMLQRLPIALAQVKAGNNSESLLNEIREIVYSLF